MKKLLLSMCGILLTSVLTAQTFTFEGLKYWVIDDNSVKVAQQNSSAISGTVNIPSAVTYNNNTYSVTAIGDYAFIVCTSLTSVTIPNSITSIGQGAFFGCSGLTSISIPNSVTSIGAEAFRSCSFVSVTIPNSVTSIGSHAFITCRNLTSVTIPNSITSIDKYTFFGCSSLTSVKCLTATPPSLDSSAFIGVGSTCTLTVPCGTIDAYEGSYWNTVFAGRISEDTPFELNVSSSDTTLGIVGISSGENCPEKILTATPASCYHFTVWNDGSTDNPRTITVTHDTTFTANFERNISRQEIYDTICEGTTYDFHGRDLTQAGTYSDTLQTINGCDSVIVLTLSVNHVATTPLSATICSNETYDFHGRDLTQAGTYSDTLQTINGCDSVIVLTLSVNHVATTPLSATICSNETYDFHGRDLTQAGTYSDTLQTINGCDSVIVLTLSVNHVATTPLSATICNNETYDFHGRDLTQAGTYSDTLQTINGCDSVIVLTLSVNPVASTPLSATICNNETYDFHGRDLTQAGTYSDTLQTINGCDSVIVLTLSINPVASTPLSATICNNETYDFHGRNLTQAGTYSDTLQTINGCDSVIVLTLSVNPVYHDTINAEICEGSVYTENGFNVNEAGTYTQTLQTINGCDSIVTLNLTVNSALTSIIDAEICEGTTYSENGFEHSEAGTYTQTLQTSNGCDSIVTLNLSMKPNSMTTFTATVCEGTVYTENGFNASETGIYTRTMEGANGCDSTITLDLTVNPSYQIGVLAIINRGETYTNFGFNESEAGTYTQHLQTVDGCDSTIMLTLVVMMSLDDATVDKNAFIFYPNPAKSFVNLEFKALKENTLLQILDLNGRKVRTFDLKAGQENLRIEIGNLPEGVYTIKFGNTVKKLIVG